MATRLRRWWWLTVPATVLAWANWSAPEMHHFVQTAETAVWQLAPLEVSAAQAVETQLAAQAGVAACAISARTHCVAVVYHPDAVTAEALCQAIGRTGARVVSSPPVPAAAPAVRQCPVPASYVLLLDRVRFALNLRRFFVAA